MSEVKGISQRMCGLRGEQPISTEVALLKRLSEGCSHQALCSHQTLFTWRKMLSGRLGSDLHLYLLGLECMLMKSLPSSLPAPQPGSAEDTLWGHTPRGILIRQLLRTKTTECPFRVTKDNQYWPTRKACQPPQPQWAICFPRRAVPTSCPRRGSYKTPKGAQVRFRNSIAHLSLGALICVPS